MADTKKYLSLEGLQSFWGKAKSYIDAADKVNKDAIDAEKSRAEGEEGKIRSEFATADTQTLASAEAAAKAYADSLAGNYDAKGSAATAEAAAKAYADGLASNYDAAGSAEQALTDAKAYADGLVGAESAIAGRVTTVEGQVETLIGSDADMSARAIVQDEVAKQLQSENISESFDTLKEMAEYLSSHPQTVTDMNAAIEANATAIATEKSRAEGVEAGLRTDVDAKVAQADYDAKMTELEGADSDLDTRIDALEKLVGVEDGEAGEDATLGTRVSVAEADIDALEAKVGENTVAANIEAAKTELKGDAADDYNTLGKLEDAILQEAADRAAADADLQTAVDSKVANDVYTTKVAELAESIRLNSEAITAINNVSTGILASANAYTDAEIAKFVAVSTDEINALEGLSA